MPNRSRAVGRATLMCLALAAAGLVTPALAQTASARPLPAIESFFDNPSFDGAALSPSGRYLATRSFKGGHDVLVVIDLEEHAAKVVASYAEADINRFQWVNDERLVFSVTNKDEADGQRMFGPGLFAINRDGSKYVELAKRSGEEFVVEGGSRIRREILPWHTFLMDEEGPQDSDFIYVESHVYSDVGELQHVDLLHLNTVTGRAQTVKRPAFVRSWMLDHKGEPRLAISLNGKISTIHYNDPARGQWRELASFDAYTGGQGAFAPVGFGPDGTLYVVARQGEDTTSLRTFNFATGKVNKDAVVATPGYDFQGSFIRNRSKLLGVRLTTDATAQVWFDPAMQAAQHAIDKVLKGTINLVSVPAQADSPYLLVRSYADVMPSNYALYNLKTGKFDPVGSAHPAIDLARMARQEPVRYKARDGLEIPGLLTLPPGGMRKNLPMVVLVHGGPWVAGAAWGWDSESQFLASRGYAVLEPSFRGTTGLGWNHFRSSWKQWGLTMQNDIADGARWAVAQGYADPARICIAGASYGGYATLMGLVNDPDLYKCGINWVGVTDINLMYNDTWLQRSDISDDTKKYSMPVMIGDQAADAAQLKATSPIEQAARIKQPLLLAYGGSDRRVPIFHGRQFYDAVKPTNRTVEWVEYPEEGHGWRLPKNRIDFWSRVEKFLDKNIGSAAAKPE